MINVGIVGHTGRLGKPLLKILENHPQVKIVYTESRKKEFGEINLMLICFF